MYRYNKMIKQFSKFPEFESYRANNLCFGKFLFKKSTYKNDYVIEISDGAFEPPLIFLKSTCKRLDKISYKEAEDEIKKLYLKITETMKECNEDYESILPFKRYEYSKYTIEIANLIEYMDNYKIENKYPEEIKIWAMIYEQEEEIGEFKFVIENEYKSKRFPLWKVKNHELLINNKSGEKEFGKYINQIFLDIERNLNEPNRIRYLLSKKQQHMNLNNETLLTKKNEI